MEIENLILRYLTGETSEQEAREVQEWLQAKEENRRLFAQHKKLWLCSGALAVYDADKIKHDRKKVELKIRNSELQRSLVRANKWIRRLAYAASILLLIGATVVLSIILQSETPAMHLELLAGGEIETSYGSKSLVTLPDGSKVWVNAGSKITYPANFGETERNVHLTGEAYFDVAKMDEIPFYVNTDLVKIIVYGTSFNVKAYPDDDRVETTLDHGAISITRNDVPNRIIRVEPNQKVTVMRNLQEPSDSSAPAFASSSQARSAETEILEMKNTEAITAWKDNRLVFDQEPLWSLAKQLERTYNVQIIFNDEKIKSIRYTAAIKEIPIDQVLEAISLTSPINYSIKGSEIILTENKNFIQQR